MVRFEFAGSGFRVFLVRVVLLILLPLISWSPVMGAKEPGRSQEAGSDSTETTKGPVDVDAYVVKGYSAVGPITVQEVRQNSLILYRYPKDMLVDLKGKRMTFLKASGARITTSAIIKGSRVFVFQKDDEVIVYLLEKREGGTNE